MLCALSLVVAIQTGESFYASSDRFGYNGTYAVYRTEAEAKAGRNPIRNGNWVQRDGSIYMVRNKPDFWETEYNAFLTNWYASPNANGSGNPNNANVGFVQMYDANATNWQNQKASWAKDLKTFTAFASGANATYPSAGNPGQFARLGNNGAPAGSGESTKGTYLSYEYSITAKFSNPATKDSTGFYKNNGNAINYSGYFKGIFRNESTTSPASNGYYVVNLAINNQSWSVDEGYDVRPDEFGSIKVAK
jgi:hypothetical protein